MKKLNEERGYALFLTVLMIVVFGVISISLVTVTMSGVQRSETREEVTQAGELAEKGVNHLAQKINAHIQDEIDGSPDSSVSVSEFKEILVRVLNVYKCESDSENGGIKRDSLDTGKYDTCVSKLPENLEKLPYDVEIKSQGTAKNKDKTINVTVQFTGNNLPDPMEYAVNTFVMDEDYLKNAEREREPGEGNLFLHGGVGIQGDIYAHRNLITSNRSFEKYELIEYWIHSYYPSALNLPKGSHHRVPTVKVGEDIYTVSWSNNKLIQNFKYLNHINKTTSEEFENHMKANSNSPYTKKDVIDDEVFVGAFVPETSVRSDEDIPQVEPIEIKKVIEEQKSKYKYTKDQADILINTRLVGGNGNGLVIGEVRDLGEKHKDKKAYLYRKDLKDDYNYSIAYDNTFKQLVVPGNLRIGRHDRNKNYKRDYNNVLEFTEGLYVAGDLHIRRDTKITGDIYVEKDLVINGKNVTIESDSLYVGKDVKIENNRGFDFNGAIYAKGSFKMGNLDDVVGSIEYEDDEGSIDDEKIIEEREEEESIIPDDDKDDEDPDQEGTRKPDNTTGDYIVYADGPIEIKRINRFSDSPLKINGYFYSNQTIQMDGNETNLHIKGGISAPRIVLNSVRGKSSLTSNIELQNVAGRGYMHWDKQQESAPRLQIHYNDNIFQKYSHLLLERRVTKPLPAKIIETKYEN